MTISAGHPDWQSYASWRGPPIVSGSAVGLGPGGNNYGITPIPHWSSLTVRAIATNRNIDVIVAFYADAGGSVIVASQEWTLNVGCALSVNTPALGPYVQVTVNNKGAAGGSMVLFVEPSNLPAPAPAYINYGLSSPLAIGINALAATTGFTVATAEIYAGPMILAFETSSGTAYHGSLSYFDTGAVAFLTLTRFQGSVSGQGGTLLVAAPAAPLQISVTNDDTVNRTISVSLTRAA